MQYLKISGTSYSIKKSEKSKFLFLISKLQPNYTNVGVKEHKTGRTNFLPLFYRGKSFFSP